MSSAPAEPASTLNVWIPGHTAVLVVHGIGNQEPLQTLDQFARGLVEEFRSRGVALSLEHRLGPCVDGAGGGGRQWLRLTRPGGGPHLDLYEYYWADIPQDRAPVGAIQRWLNAAVKGALSFYGENKSLVEEYEKAKSPFFVNGRFSRQRYGWFLFVAGQAIPAVTGTLRWLARAVESIPVVGQVLPSPLASVEAQAMDLISNVVGDVVVFNSVQARSPFLALRETILRGCVGALRSLVEPAGEGPWTEDRWPYARVLVAGHSLGSQVAFEAMNRVNLLAATGQLRGVDAAGRFRVEPNRVHGREHLREMLCGFVTFGSPLDKVAFFFREVAPEGEAIRRRMLEHLRCFKHKSWCGAGKAAGCGGDWQSRTPVERLLDGVRWVNYHDAHDPVSGSLDYYEPLENRECGFVKGDGHLRARRRLGAAAAVWVAAGLTGLCYWLWQVWNLEAKELVKFSVGGFVLGNWIHLLAAVLFGVWGLGLLLAYGRYFARTFTHLRYWNREDSPLYRGFLDDFLLPPVVTSMETPKPPPR